MIPHSLAIYCKQVRKINMRLKLLLIIALGAVSLCSFAAGPGPRPGPPTSMTPPLELNKPKALPHFHHPQIVCHMRKIRCLTRYGSLLAGTLYIEQHPVKRPQYTICLPTMNPYIYGKLVKTCNARYPATCKHMYGFCIPKF